MRYPGLYVVILPTYNRAGTLGRALQSLLGQTDSDWRCHVLDDGSTDGTGELVRGFKDSRIVYQHFEQNRGGVAMNELGMALACADGTIWARLGSDDWFGPRKIELDRLALGESYGGCYGPYQHYGHFRGPWQGSTEWTGELNSPQDARAMLLRGEFSVSWANIALRTDVLANVRMNFGCFVDPRLRNMEDYLFNVRAARFTEFAWRGHEFGGDRVLVGAVAPEQVPFPYEPDAFYTVATESASYGVVMKAWLTRDAQLTDVCRGADHALGITPLALHRPTPVLV